MKPVNLDNSPCTPQSSNCVIWQGPDIPCIKLCAGDVVTDVIYNLAIELCTILDQLDVKNYDLTCFGINNCGPNDFNALIQFLIDQICELQGVTPTPEKSGSGCPDCIVSTAECFILKGYPASMQLLEYVNAIATEICSILNRLTFIDQAIFDLQETVNFIRTTYCATCPTLEIPDVTLGCDIGILDTGSTYPISTILTNFFGTDSTWCNFVAATGDTGSILASVASQCLTQFDATKTNPLQTYGDLTGWVDNPVTIADSIYNIWLVLCDLYNVAQVTITAEDTPTIITTLSAGPDYVISSKINDTGWKNLEGFTYMSSNSARPQCRRIGNIIYFKGVIQVPMGDAGSGASGTAHLASSPDAYRSYDYGRTLNSTLSGDPNACAINGANPTATIPSGSTNINEGIVIYFNRGVRAIPTSVLPASLNLDGTTTAGNRQFIFRSIDIGADSVFLSSISTVFVSETGIVGMTAPYNNENYSGTGIEYSSMQRNVVSNIISGENIPLYDPTAPSINNAPATPPSTYNADIIVSAETWPFTMNCMSAFQLGGFSIRLDGLFAYIDPCDTDIVTYATCS